MDYISTTKPWLKHYNQDSLNRSLPQCTLYEQLYASNTGYENGVALSYYGTSITYGELLHNIDIYTRAFYAAGVRKGDYVSFYTVTTPETIYSIYALNRLGAVCNLIDVRTDRTHTIDYIKKANSKFLIAIDLCVDTIADAFEDLALEKVIIQSAFSSVSPLKRLVMKLGAGKRFDTGLLKNPHLIMNSQFIEAGRTSDYEVAPYEENAAAVITRTGGTTGVSKGVVLTNDSMNAVYENFRAVFGDMSGESILNFLPLAASYGIVVGVHAALCSSLNNILIPKFRAEDFPKLVYKFRPNHIVGVPGFYENLIQYGKSSSADLSFIITMGAGGDTPHPTLEKRLTEFASAHGVKYPLASGYGMSETSSACAFGVKDIHRDGSVGIPNRYSVISVFEPGTTNELGIGEVGEICISGATLMKEYLNEPEETAHVMRKHPDGQVWVHSGDLGYIDEDGFLYINGRIKRSIIRFDGHKNYPVQIEDIIDEHPAVAHNVVIGVPDPDHNKGELPLSIVELKNEYSYSKELKEDILDYCKNNIEERSQLYDIVVIDKLPKTNMGKMDIKGLTEVYHDYRRAN